LLVNGKSSECANELEIAWLNRYPLPTEVVCDRGTESKVIIIENDSRRLQTSKEATRNPQANAMVERVHKTINTTIYADAGISCPDELHDKFDGYLSAVTKAINSTVRHMLHQRN
jgi:hypothetical protein